MYEHPIMDAQRRGAVRQHRDVNAEAVWQRAYRSRRGMQVDASQRARDISASTRRANGGCADLRDRGLRLFGNRRPSSRSERRMLHGEVQLCLDARVRTNDELDVIEPTHEDARPQLVRQDTTLMTHP